MSEEAHLTRSCPASHLCPGHSPGHCDRTEPEPQFYLKKTPKMSFIEGQVFRMCIVAVSCVWPESILANEHHEHY